MDDCYLWPKIEKFLSLIHRFKMVTDYYYSNGLPLGRDMEVDFIDRLDKEGKPWR